MTTSETPANTKPSIGGIIKNGAIAGVIAVVVNAILYVGAAALGWFPETVLTPAGVPITLAPVVSLTVGAAIAGTVGYLILSRFLSRPKANLWFTILAVIVLVVMAVTPLQLPGAPIGQIVTLEIMHLVAGLPLIYFLPRSA